MAVHPRACGEHLVVLDNEPLCRGSSPRLRGTRSAHSTRRTGRRFIPAPAGNTISRRGWPASGPVHPRACGEHMGKRRHPMLLNGSSPRLRGTRSACGRVH
ncbi:hypothetical protein HMPREF0731_3078 [Pseudoroseomonas cervicalis ATCC 49957]|nr:hypothetical protein HMPREF0731_3078 [Pseudoroseomonas cervicalis ATCC 49957]